MKNFDKDLLLAAFLFLSMLGIWIWIRDPWLQRGCDMLLGAVVMGLKSGISTPDKQ